MTGEGACLSGTYAFILANAAGTIFARGNNKLFIFKFIPCSGTLPDEINL
jgi:hypothetical protein